MFLLIVFNTSVPAVLPIGQCIERYTAKNYANVTDQYEEIFSIIRWYWSVTAFEIDNSR